MTFQTKHPDLVIGLFGTFFAPKAYAYLVIVDGQATISVVLTQDFKRGRLYLDHSLEMFRRIKHFDMENIRITSGFGGLVKPEKTARHPLIIGEAAGFQDFLWGFGIRKALYSGHLAARAIAEDLDYETLVNNKIRPQIRSSLRNRLLFDLAGDRTYRLLVKRFAASPDLPKLLRRWYLGSPLDPLLWPIIKQHYRNQF